MKFWYTVEGLAWIDGEVEEVALTIDCPDAESARSAFEVEFDDVVTIYEVHRGEQTQCPECA